MKICPILSIGRDGDSVRSSGYRDCIRDSCAMWRVSPVDDNEGDCGLKS